MVRPPETARFSVPWTLRDVFTAVAVIVGVAIFFFFIGSSLAVALFRPETQTGLIYIRLAWLVVLEVALFLSAWSFSVRKYDLPWSELGFRPMPIGRMVLLTLAVIGVAYAITLVYIVIIQVFGWDFLLPRPLPQEFTKDSAIFLPLSLLALFAAPLAEETFFRGFLFPSLSQQFGLVWGAVASGGLFGLSHVDPGLIFPTGVLGVFFAFMYYRTRSLWAPMLAHFTYNAISLAVAT